MYKLQSTHLPCTIYIPTPFRMVLLPGDKVKAIASEIKASGDLKIKGAKAATLRDVCVFRMDFVGSETG